VGDGDSFTGQGAVRYSPEVESALERVEFLNSVIHKLRGDEGVNAASEEAPHMESISGDDLQIQAKPGEVGG